MSLGNVLNSFEDKGIEYRFLGFINIESNVVALSSRSFEYCEECSGTSFESIQFACSECGRTTDNYVFIGSGDGDGIYVVTELFVEGNKIGLLAVFDSNYGLANQYRSFVEQGIVPVFEKNQIEKYLRTHFARMGNLTVDSTILIGDQYNSDEESEGYVTLHVEGLQSSNYEVGGFFELPSEYSFEDQLGPRTNPTLRVLIALEKEIAESLNIQEEPVISSWSEYLIGQLEQIVTSHKVVVSESVRDLNAAYSELQNASISEGSHSPSLGLEGKGSNSLKAAFCATCGSSYESDLANFCSSCGHQRS